MSKLNKKIVDNFVKSVKMEVKQDSDKSDNLKKFVLDDVVVFLDENDNLYSILFEVLGREFSILKDYKIYVLETDENGMESTYSLDDTSTDKLVRLLEIFIQWRQKVLINIKI